MRAVALLVGLYPPAVRERWGAEIGHEVAASGIRSWPDTVLGAARLWLRPSEWPESLAGQTRRVLAVAMFAIIAVSALLVRAIAPSATLTTDTGHPATSLWLAPVLLGVALAAPLPPLRIRYLTGLAIRTLAAPGLAAVALVLAARSGLPAHGLIVFYWATLGSSAVGGCVLIERVTRTARMPGTRRLCAALLLIGAGLTLAAGQTLLAVLRYAPHAGSISATLALGVLATVSISAGRDLALRPGSV